MLTYSAKKSYFRKGNSFLALVFRHFITIYPNFHMKTKKDETNGISLRIPAVNYSILATSSVTSAAMAFVVALLPVSMFAKIAFLGVFLGILFCLIYALYRNDVEAKGKNFEEVEDESKASLGREAAVDGLEILDEAGKFFSASLRSDDMFRLIASRIDGIIPHKHIVLFTVEDGELLNPAHAAGESSREFTKLLTGKYHGIAGDAFQNDNPILVKDISKDRKSFGKILTECNASVAVPLKQGMEIFGVLALYGIDYSENDKNLLKSVGERVSPMIVSSFSFEQNIANSMTDALTKLPNERAFYVVLENQIAEAQRFQEGRPLTILTIDIRDFADFNRRFGHSTGDNLLAFAAGVISGELRKMDFLCRSMNDEFWVVLPTASEKITRKIVQRIETAFAEKAFALDQTDKFYAQMNFGSATFLRDGESTNHLLQKALLRKRQTKSRDESSVIMFPREYVN